MNVKADKWPGQIWWANTPLIISGPAISGESGSLAQKVMCCHWILFTFNISVIIAREVWYNQKQVRLSLELSSWYLNVSLLNWWEEAERQVRNKYGATTLCAVADKSVCQSNVRCGSSHARQAVSNFISSVQKYLPKQTIWNYENIKGITGTIAGLTMSLNSNTRTVPGLCRMDSEMSGRHWDQDYISYFISYHIIFCMRIVKLYSIYSFICIPTKQCQQHILNGIMMTASNI